MTWTEYVAAVDSHLQVEANRRGLTAYRDRYMRNAVLDLQRFIRGYRNGNTTTYQVANVTTEGQAQLVVLPDGALPKALYIYSVIDGDDSLCKRERLEFYPWLKKQDLICGKLDFWSWWGACWPIGGCPNPPDTTPACDLWAWANRKAYVYTIGPFGKNLLIYPQITTDTRLLVVWDGYRYSFSGGDTVNFPQESSEAVATYILQKIARDVDKDRTRAADLGLEYTRLRLSLWRDFQETQDAEQKGEEYGATVVAPP